MNNYSDPKRILWLGVSIMLVLIGIAAVLSDLFNSHSFVGAGSSWLNSIWVAIGVLLSLFFLFGCGTLFLVSYFFPLFSL